MNEGDLRVIAQHVGVFDKVITRFSRIEYGTDIFKQSKSTGSLSGKAAMSHKRLSSSSFSVLFHFLALSALTKEQL